MRVVIFCHSLVSDWNHGNAHFLRGVARALVQRGHVVSFHEPADGWSRSNLVAEHGEAPLAAFAAAYPELSSRLYPPGGPELAEALAGADLVLVHEWTDPELVRRIGAFARAGARRPVLLFHDTHHRAVTDPAAMAAYDLSGYDGVLAFGAALRDLYLARGWTARAWTWHEAANTTLFRPRRSRARDLRAEGDGDSDGELIWIGNWGDDERTAELEEFLIEPVRRLGIAARVHGVRYPPAAQAALARAGIAYGGWLPNFEVPAAFARFQITVHVPRRPYARALPGIPTIRPFEALACGIPLVSAPWSDVEHLFRPGEDFLVARDGDEMVRHLRDLLESPARRRTLASRGRRAIARRHTCAHRAAELLAIARGIAGAEDESTSRGVAP